MDYTCTVYHHFSALFNARDEISPLFWKKTKLVKVPWYWSCLDYWIFAHKNSKQNWFLSLVSTTIVIAPTLITHSFHFFSYCSIRLTTFDIVKRLIAASEKEFQRIVEENRSKHSQNGSNWTSLGFWCHYVFLTIILLPIFLVEIMYP